MVQLFRQAEDKAVYIALLSAICGNTVPTIKQKKPTTKSMIESQPFIARDTDFDEVDSPRPNTNRSPCVVKLLRTILMFSSLLCHNDYNSKMASLRILSLFADI